MAHVVWNWWPQSPMVLFVSVRLLRQMAQVVSSTTDAACGGGSITVDVGVGVGLGRGSGVTMRGACSGSRTT